MRTWPAALDTDISNKGLLIDYTFREDELEPKLNMQLFMLKHIKTQID